MSPMLGLALATIAFVATHLAMSHPLRPALVARLGPAPFTLVYSLVAIATLGAMILAWRSAGEAAPLWVAPGGWWPIASALMLVASLLLTGSLVRNPAFPRPGRPPDEFPAPRGVFAVTRHPMNWSFILWALVHISVWGSPRNLIVASGILLLAIVGSVGQDRKKARLLGTRWTKWQAQTSFLPFAGLISGRIPWRRAAPNWPALLAGAVLWALVTAVHAPSVSPLGDLLAG